MKTRSTLPLLSLLSVLCAASVASAQSDESGENPTTAAIDDTVETLQRAKESYTFSIYWENDIFANTDSNYTNGFKMTWISPDLTDYTDSPALPEWSGDAVGRLPFINDRGVQRNVAISLGQNMYTPQDIETTAFQPNDRPYAGWLYLGVALHNKTERWLDTVEISLGVIGPASLAEPTQKFVHEYISPDSPEPMGWDYQLKNEPTLNIVWERKVRLARMGDSSGFGADTIGHFGAALGNVYIYANGGISGRLGWNLPIDYGASTIRMAGDTNAPSSALDPRFSKERGFGFHVFGGINGSAIARDIFLDGNTFRDSHSVDKKPLVGEASLGISVLYGRWKLSYAQIVRSKQFETQDRDYHSFGSFNLSFSY